MKFWKIITITGTAPVYLVFVVLLSAFSSQNVEATFWLKSLIPSGVAWILATFLKRITKKKRPDTEELDAMPSSHAAASMAWATTLFALKNEWALIVSLWALFIILSRYFLKRHDVWDLLAGVILGMSCTYFIS
jgi:membrane-associated phospholipid phosphatase